MKNYVLMLMACIFWAGAFIAGKSSVASFGPFTLTFYRFGIAALILMPLMVLKYKADLKLDGQRLGEVFILGIVGMAGYHVLFFEALKFIPASNASIIASTNPMMTALIMALFFKERLEKAQILFLVTAFMGVVLTISNWQLGRLLTQGSHFGEGLMIIAVLCWAYYSALVKRYIVHFRPIVLSFYVFLSCAIMVFPFAMNEGLIYTSIKAPLGAWQSIFYMAFFASVLGYWIQQESIRQIGPAKTNIFVNVVPVFSMLMAMVILKENIPLSKWLSASIIILSVLMFNGVSQMKARKIKS